MCASRDGFQQVVSVGVTSTALLQADSTRKRVMFSSPVAARVTISNSDPAVLDRGLNLVPLGAPVRMDAWYDGSWVQQRLNAIAAAGTELIGLIVTIDRGDSMKGGRSGEDDASDSK